VCSSDLDDEDAIDYVIDWFNGPSKRPHKRTLIPRSK
jgi:hypothetical protein